ncbi:MAG: LysM peptidoglycan-binding domain-containing protein [Candidatus Magnetomorum sp.]|nr:LysM peptidoglycan-binding domain-containing protein [Candidatus Magnetomorum sp.]
MKLTGRKKNTGFNLFFCLFFLFTTLFPVAVLASQDKYFPVPPFLCDNVLFWKKVYTDVSVDEGLLHDREYPLIIYQTLHVGSRRGRTLEQYVDGYKKRIADVLRGLTNKLPANRSEEENRFVEMFKEYSSLKDIPRAMKRIRFQLGQRESFLKGLEQSGMYIDEIFAIIKREHLPLRLAYLPHVESSFNTHALSKAGAAGLWQFMWETGKNYLDIDRYIDERRDPILSTEAAIQLLKKNYTELNSWPLAITAYNYGLAGIKRAVQSTGSKDIAVIIQKHKSQSFQFASKNFYSCFLAACEIDENYQRYFKLVKMDTPLLRKRFILEQAIKPDDLCKRLNISLSEFKALNPAYKPSLYKYDALIPRQYTVFLPLTVPHDDFADIFHFSKPKNNRLADPAQLPQIQETVARTKSLQKKEPVSIKTPQYKKHATPSTSEKKRSYQKYRVKKGDSIWLIAKKFNIDGQTLRAINGLTRKSYIYKDQLLRIPISPSKKLAKKELRKHVTQKHIVSPKIPPKQDSSHDTITKNTETTLWKKYRVKEGDTLWDISKVMKLSPKKLKAINQLKTQRLQPGQILFVPQSSPAPLPTYTQTDAHQAAIERIRKLREQQKQQEFIIDYYYTVQSGEDLTMIAQKTDIPLEHIAMINHMSKDLRVYEGQVLRIPQKPKESMKVTQQQ